MNIFNRWKNQKWRRSKRVHLLEKNGDRKKRKDREKKINYRYIDETKEEKNESCEELQIPL